MNAKWLCFASSKKKALEKLCDPELGMDPECRSRLWQDSAFFLRTRSQKFVKNRIRSHFSISAIAGVCVVFSSVKTWINFDLIDDVSRSLNRSRILKFENLLDPGPDSKILEQERSRSLKKWLRPPLLCAGMLVNLF